MATKQKALLKAKASKQDEFYTRYEDVHLELHNYDKHFKDKIVFCNCDDPTFSSFWQYFHLNFERLGLKKLISTHYEADDSPSYALIYEGGDDLTLDSGKTVPLNGNGDFRSEEAIEFLKEADIVVTNPPFSLFREYLAQLMTYKKDFIIIGSINNVTYRDVFSHIQNSSMWLGATMNGTGQHWFMVPDDYDTGLIKIIDGVRCATIGDACWYTNLDIDKRHERFFKPEQMPCFYEGREEQYPEYDNFSSPDGLRAIETGAVAKIPIDYNGYMGVPVSFLAKHNKEEFEIVGNSSTMSVPVIINGKKGSGRFYINNRRMYDRLVIKNLHPISKSEDEAQWT